MQGDEGKKGMKEGLDRCTGVRGFRDKRGGRDAWRYITMGCKYAIRGSNNVINRQKAFEFVREDGGERGWKSK